MYAIAMHHKILIDEISDRSGTRPQALLPDYGVAAAFVAEEHFARDVQPRLGDWRWMFPKQWYALPMIFPSDAFSFSRTMLEVVEGETVQRYRKQGQFLGSVFSKRALAGTDHWSGRRIDCKAQVLNLMMDMLAPDPAVRPSMGEMVARLHREIQLHDPISTFLSTESGRFLQAINLIENQHVSPTL
ncbi:hypothetical protein CALVIDRAFT_535530 [Calocera viscosa TUFC12733]|uniref:Protein kinase domain-containing protein n=1 Tax=Calocera viscosa (strain TUFC12733) TaxID=1330018 RepID=A0A167P5K1_CALVF|nr:hypothetical protein CALVIDRAFT_535530 [Calocera viscosa TUFC12733]